MKTEINGIQIAFEVLGRTGYSLVLIHGFGLNRSIWKPMASVFFGEQYTILLDLRGHGESDAPEGLYNMCLFAEDIVGLLDHLGIEKAILCGHSLGGYVALAFAMTYPDRLAGLGMITSRSGADSEEARMGRYELAEKVRENGSVELAKTLVPRLTTDETIRKQSSAIIEKTHPTGIIGAAMGMAERPDRSHLLKEIKVPALVVAGEEDLLIDTDQAVQMAELLPNGELLIIPNAGHMPMLETPEALAEGLLSLAQRVSEQRP